MNIESLQDEERFKSSSQGGGLEVEFGFGNNWSLSGYGNASSGKTQRKQVNEQAGLFAEEGGYHINADQVHLKAGAIASQNPQNSELRTNSLTFEDIQNSSASRAMSGGVSGGIAERKGESQRQETPNQAGTNPNITNAKQEGNGNSFNPSLPMAYRSQDESVTKATLTEGTIILNKDSQPTQTTAAALGINTELAQANRQTAATADVKAQVAEQQQIAAAVNQVRSAAETFSTNKREEAELVLQQRQAELAIAKAQGDKAKEAQLKDQVDTAQEAVNDWSTGGKNRQAVDATLNGLGLALGGNSVEAVAAGAASPYVNTAIKHATEGSEWANLALHGIWGAVEAATQGANALGGASSAVTGEVAAKILSEKLYGETNPEALTEEQKRAVSHLSQMIAGAVSGGTELAQGGDAVSSVQNVNVGMGIAKNAVENNYLSKLSVNRKEWLREQLQRGDLSSKKRAQYEQEFIQLEKDDHTSDFLVKKAKYTPEKMTEQDWALYIEYAHRYISESTEKPIKVKDNLRNLLSDTHIKSYSYPYALDDKYRKELPSREGWFFGVNRGDDEKFYDKIKDKYDAMDTYNKSFNANMSKSTYEAMGYLVPTSGVLAAVPKVSSSIQVTANGVKKFVANYPNISGAIIDGSISGGSHVAYKFYAGQEINEYELSSAVLGGALTRNKSLGNQVRINIGIATVSSLSKDPSGNSLGNDYFGAVTSPIISKPFGDMKYGGALGGYASEFLGDIESRKIELLELQKKMKETD